MGRATKRKLRTVTRERDEARRIAEESARAGVEADLFGAEESVLPWQDYATVMRSHGMCPGCGWEERNCECEPSEMELFGSIDIVRGAPTGETDGVRR